MMDDRKHAAEDPRTSEQSFRLILDMIPGFIYTLAPTGELEYCSQQLLDLFGTTLEELQDWARLVHPEDLDRLSAKFSRCIATGEPFDDVHRALRVDGVYRWTHSQARPWKRDGQIERWFGVVMDIDEMKQADERLRRSEARLAQAMQIATVGELAASIAHEVNQPLAAVVTNGHACLRWLSAQPPNLTQAREAAERIVRDGKDAGEVVHRVRSLFHRAEVERLPLDVNEVIGEVLRLIERDLKRRRATIEADLDASLPSVLGDRVQLQQLALNLLKNALEAMDSVVERPRRLFIRSRRQDNQFAVVEVRDRGGGMKEPERAFEAFFTTKEGGMGVGLAICRSIVEAHDGKIWVAPSDGVGTTICFVLPLCPKETP